MRSGKLRHPVTIQAPTETTSLTGAITTTWATFAKTRAELKPQGTMEGFSSSHVSESDTIQFRCRYIKGLTRKMRFVYAARIYDIQAITDVQERHQEHIIIGTEYIA